MIEALAIRISWIAYALRLKRTPGLCPAGCRNAHTYKWPCRARFQESFYKNLMREKR